MTYHPIFGIMSSANRTYLIYNHRLHLSLEVIVFIHLLTSSHYDLSYNIQIIKDAIISGMLNKRIGQRGRTKGRGKKDRLYSILSILTNH